MISHPYGPARSVQLNAAREALIAAGLPRQLAPVLAAIGQAATGLDLAAVDTDQLHGYLRVGAWAVNYYGPAYQAALSLAGPPARLAAGTAAQQATAAVALWREHGLDYWPEFSSGAWRDTLSAGQLRSLPATIDARPPAQPVPAAGQAAGAILRAQTATALPSLQAATAAVTQLQNTIGATTNG